MKRILTWFSLAALVVAAPAFAQFIPGQVLSASELNSAFSTVVPKAGGTLTGPLVMPSATIGTANIAGGTIAGLSAPIGFASGGTNATTALGATSQLQFQSTQPGSAARSIASKLADRVNVMDFPGCDPTGVADSTTCIQTAINSVAASSGTVQGGAQIEFPSGSFRTTASINTAGRSGVRLVGAGRLSTVLIATGNYPLIVDNGTYTAVDNKVGVAHMWLQCAGMSGSNSHGISFTYVNSASIRDVFITGCNHALDLYDNWQTEIDGVRVDGVGAQQNSIGIYAGAPTNAADTMPNNALVVTNTTVQNVALYAFRLVYFAGSKFTNVEGTNGVTAWYLCDGAYVQTSVACQFGHFSNILADTTSGPGITIQQGANTNPVKDVMLSNVWIGNSVTYGLLFNGATYSTARGVHIASTDMGVYIKNSNYVTVDADIHNYNRGNIGSYAVVFDGTSNSVVHAVTQTGNAVLGYNGITETGTGSGNQIWGGAAPCTLGVAFGGASTGITYGSRACQYQIQGQRVSVQFSLGLSAVGSATGSATLTGLPITVGSTSGNGAISALAGLSGMSSLTSQPSAQGVSGGTTANLLMQGASGTTAMTNSNFTSSSALAGQLTYFKQ